MKLRQKFLTLVAVLLILVLGGSFAFLFSDLRTEFEKDFQMDLESSAAAFRAQEQERFRTLEVIALFLEGSPSFRNVLRRSDYQTMHEYLLDVNGSMQVTLILLTDSQGKLLNRTDREGEQGADLSNEGPIKGALEGQYITDYWLEDNALYQVVSIPLVDSHDYVDGCLTLGFLIDQSFLTDLKTELGGEVAFKSGPNWTLSTSSELLADQHPQLLTKRLALGESERPSGFFMLGKSLEPVQKFVRRSQFKLANLAIAALLVALLVSIPLIGKMTNPVELLEQTQAEMKTIFTANLDGLLATDEQGLITTCNPAATIALGHEADKLIGSPITEKLPSSVHTQLESAPGVSQVATFTRQGRDFKLYRTFVRLGDSDLLGSIFLFHDITQEKERENLFFQFLEGLKSRVVSADAAPPVKLGLRNLQTWLDLKKENLVVQRLGCELHQIRKSIEELWKDEERLTLKFPENVESKVLADLVYLDLALQNLIRLGLEESGSSLLLEISKEGGSFRFHLRVEAEQLDLLGELITTATDEPFHSPLGLQGLSLFVSIRLLELHDSRLQISNLEDSGGTEFSFVLPVDVGPC